VVRACSDDYGKLWFNILDYTGSATRMFADPTFDGDPVRITEEQVNDEGDTTSTTEVLPEAENEPIEIGPEIIEPPGGESRKFYYDGGQVEIVAHLVHELDPNGKQLRVVRYTDYAADTVRTLCPSAQELRQRWADAMRRAEIIEALTERGIAFENSPSRPSNPKPTLLTCFAILPSMRPCVRDANERNA
jgi:type I restriction enzyme, R subunit